MSEPTGLAYALALVVGVAFMLGTVALVAAALDVGSWLRERLSGRP